MNDVYIESLHRNIAKTVRQIVSVAVEVGPVAANRNWKIQHSPVTVEFELQSPANSVLLDTVERSRGGRSPVVPIIEVKEFEDTVWASWYEKWDKVSASEYKMIGVSWSFYWGKQGRSKAMLFRSDWDALDDRSPIAAQPHWHVDTEFMVQTFRRLPQASAKVPSAIGEAGLIELPSEQSMALEELVGDEQVQDLSIGGVHLGMGLFMGGKDLPGCWRHAIPESKWAELNHWVRQTLEYIRDQFIAYPVEAGEPI